jgi:hypothetical protein
MFTQNERGRDHEIEGIEGNAQPNGQQGLQFKHPPEPRVPRDTFPEVTPFASPYKSVFTTNPPMERPVRDVLKHANCSYLSSNIRAPILLELKRHAQSLAVLIRELTVSTLPAMVDNAQSGRRPFSANSSFDWLNNLNIPYTTDENHHLQPLHSILNTVEQSLLTGEERNRCPLHQMVDENPLGQVHPLARHGPLIQHANEILERLDHEYSARGGLLSIYPTEIKKCDREKANKTVLGQMIFGYRI